MVVSKNDENHNFLNSQAPTGGKDPFNLFTRHIALSDDLSPVSYTHLDVYKRQYVYCENAVKVLIASSSTVKSVRLKIYLNASVLKMGSGGVAEAFRNIQNTSNRPRPNNPVVIDFSVMSFLYF